MNFWKREVVMSAKIEYGYSARQEGRTISPQTRLEDNSGSTLEGEVKEVISSRLPSDMAQIYGLTVKTRIITTRYGSLTVFFGVLLSGLAFIAKYKSFFDSIQLIQQHLTLLLSGRLRDRFREELEINVSVEQPKLDDPREIRFPRELQRFFHDMPFGPEFGETFSYLQLLGQSKKNRRDAFFWFLLAFCILLIGFVGVLIFTAMKKTYFP